MLKKYPHLSITLFASLLFIPFLGSVHLFDWDEINFAEAAREMIESGNYSRVQINFEPFWEKPPMFFWMQAGCMKLFGINEFAARLPNAICGILTLNFLFYYGKKLFDSTLAWWWVLLFVGSFTPHLYFKSGIIDPWYNLLIFGAIVQLYLGSCQSIKNINNYIFAGILLGMAILTKGPVAILIVALSGFAYMAMQKFEPFFRWRDLATLIFSTLLVPLLWLLPDLINNGFWFTNEFLNYQLDLFLNPVASHGQPWFYHPLVLLTACFPAAIVALPFLFKTSNSQNPSFLLWMKLMFWVVLILFSMVTTKIVHYSSLCYIPLAFLGAFGLQQTKGILKSWQTLTLVFLGLLYSLVFMLIPLLGSNSALKNKLIHAINDPFVNENLRAPTPWHGHEWVIGLAFLLLTIIGLLWLNRKSDGLGLKVFLVGNALFLLMINFSLMPKIENHLQGPIINFYKSLVGKNIYIETVGFKSYAHYYYTQKPAPNKNDALSKAVHEYSTTHGIKSKSKLSQSERDEINGFKMQWFLNGKIDKPVYLVYKITNTEGMDTMKSFKMVMNSGGFKVFKRSH